MAVPQDKKQLIDAIEKNYRLLKIQIDRVPPLHRASKVMEGHAKDTVMSLDDLLSYLIGWGQLVLKWQKNYQNVGLIDFPETNYKWNELGRLAQKFYLDYKEYNSQELIQLLDNVVLEILRNIGETTNFDLYEKPWYGKWTLGRMIQFNTASPYNNAKNRIAKHLKSA
ncbi:ClbS/DfsB family four-helix bundle protein [Flavobacterium sp. HSC-61S13]|uniref:ClbS/DfsB family four-helix bundle protein n=1 Tax=Flavobacterium sp. HSC-61S13 TaxID=2910963 RepID=UPI0020A15C19|nr:ClbS/DfsB family four-helix bundle protein [Flavobacterium sp. HSC-61S13]MCP1995951.1 hypothetical protein [Flavobacterium sp. HSC-61S13]